MAETKFIQTEVGRIPQDWVVFSVEEDCSVKARIGWQGLSKAEFKVYGDYALITGTDIVGGKVNWSSCVFVGKERYLQDPNIIVRENDVLVSKDGTIGKVAVVLKLPIQAVLNSGVFVIRKANNKIAKESLGIIFTSPYFKNFIKRLTAGSTIVHLYQKDIVKFQFPLPPLAEQERIASALTAADNLIASLDKQIAKARNLKQATMQHLLSSLPNHSPLKPLGEVAEIIRGVRVVTSNLIPNGKYPVVSGGTGYMGYLNNYNREPNTITIAQYGTAGYVNWQEQKFWANDVCFCVKPDIKLIENKYLYYTLANLQEYLYSISNRDATPYSIDRNKILETRIPVPPIEEQERIASILTAMDNQIATLEKKRSKYEMVKQGMMQQLLTGTIRLI